MAQKTGEIFFLLQEYIFQQRKNRTELRRLGIPLPYRLEKFLRITGNLDLVDQQVLACSTQLQSDEFLAALRKNAIAIDLAALDVIYIVIHYESIHRPDKLEIAQIWEQIGLHDGEFHL